MFSVGDGKLEVTGVTHATATHLIQTCLMFISVTLMKPEMYGDTHVFGSHAQGKIYKGHSGVI